MVMPMIPGICYSKSDHKPIRKGDNTGYCEKVPDKTG
jgi:hypothetical protein